MRTLRVDDMPIDLYEGIRRSAARNGRSVNDEMLARLGREPEAWHGNQEWWDGFVSRRGRMRESLRPDAPAPEDIIRAARDGQ
jgi:hypothetical protein